MNGTVWPRSLGANGKLIRDSCLQKRRPNLLMAGREGDHLLSGFAPPASDFACCEVTPVLRARSCRRTCKRWCGWGTALLANRQAVMAASSRRMLLSSIWPFGCVERHRIGGLSLGTGWEETLRAQSARLNICSAGKRQGHTAGSLRPVLSLPALQSEYSLFSCRPPTQWLRELQPCKRLCRHRTPQGRPISALAASW